MSVELASDFFSSVRSNPEAVARLSGCRNSDEFIDRAVVLGQEFGFEVERDHILEAIRGACANQSSAPASELTDDDLDMVQAGSWEVLIKPEISFP